MRSYQYCNFEVILSTEGPATLAEVDALRRDAAGLVDKAVDAYRDAKHSGATPPQADAVVMSDERIIDRTYSQE